jgi:hypothetical protein
MRWRGRRQASGRPAWSPTERDRTPVGGHLGAPFPAAARVPPAPPSLPLRPARRGTATAVRHRPRNTTRTGMQPQHTRGNLRESRPAQRHDPPDPGPPRENRVARVPLGRRRPTPTRTPQAPLLPAQPGRRRTCPPGSSPRCGNHHGTPPPAPRHCLWWRSVTATKADTAQRLIGTIENLRRLAQADSCPNDLMIQIMSITDDFSKWLKIGNSGIELSHHTLTLLNRLAQLTRPNPLDLPVLEKLALLRDLQRALRHDFYPTSPRRARLERYPQASRRTRCATNIAVRLLPPSDRSRYRQEFAAELADLPRTDQAPYAIRLVTRAWSLRRSLQSSSHRSSINVAVGSAAASGTALLAGISWPGVVLGGMTVAAIMWTITSQGRTQRLTALIRAVRNSPDLKSKG